MHPAVGGRSQEKQRRVPTDHTEPRGLKRGTVMPSSKIHIVLNHSWVLEVPRLPLGSLIWKRHDCWYKPPTCSQHTANLLIQLNCWSKSTKLLRKATYMSSRSRDTLEGKNKEKIYEDLTEQKIDNFHIRLKIPVKFQNINNKEKIPQISSTKPQTKNTPT